MITREEFAEEDRRIKQLRRDGYDERFIKGWRKKWREVGSKSNV